MIGRTLGHYRILAQIGEGGMGVVYRARDLHLERDVAVKVLPTGTLADESERKRFRREALALSRQNHPHIATVYDFDNQDGVEFLVMELVSGQPLDARLANGALTETQVCAIGAQIADALEAAHEQGIVHRDLKPGNVVLTAKGQVKVLDFGLARLMGASEGSDLTRSLTDTGVAVGTVPYMAPEQLLGRKVDARADLYALGVVLYEMATGRSPYRETVATALVYEIVNQPAPSPRGRAPALSRRLDTIILNCLEKDPERRYPSARALADDLRSSAPVVRRKRRTVHPAWIAAAAMAAAVAILAGLFVLDIGGLRSRLSGAGGIQSLAVLPLENLSHDPEQAYFADGMTEELSTRLARISALRVIAHGSVVAAAGGKTSLAAIGHALRVATVLEGSVRQDANRVRITLQLVQVATGKLLWAESYDRALRDVLTLQSDVAMAVVREIQVKLTPQEQSRMSSTAQVDPQAYQLCLKGRYAWGKYTEEGFRQAEKDFRSAIEIAPTYAPAWAGLADAAYGMSSLVLPPSAAIPRARQAAEKALALDGSLPEAHTSLGIVKMVYDWDWAGAEKEFDRAIALRPGDANARLWRGHLLVCVGRFDEGLAELRKALDLDPLSPWIGANLGWHLYFAGRPKEAIDELRTAAATSPEYHVYHVFLGLALMAQGDPAGAVASLEKAVSLDRNNDDIGQLAQAYGFAGRRKDAERLIAELDERRQHGFVPASSFVVAYSGLGDKDQTFRWIDRAFEDHSEYLIFLKVDPTLATLRSDPRYAAALRRLHLGG